jgi:hypothetical protein
MNARMIEVALMAWDAVGHLPICTREAMDATDHLVESVKSALLSLAGVDAVEWAHGSMGSIYFEVFSDTDDGGFVSVKFRVSNHKPGRRGNELAGGIVTGYTESQIQEQLERVESELASELELV